MLSEEHERNDAWRHIWLIDHGYYNDLPIAMRNDLKKSLRDFLDVQRTAELAREGQHLGGRDESPSERPVNDQPNSLPAGTSLYDPALYSFGDNRSWIPWASDATSGAKRGRYAKGHPEGLVLHWTAGHRNGLSRGNDLMRDTGMLYLIMDKDGGVAQSDSLKHWGYHAGKSTNFAVRGTVSNEFVGLEVQAAGQLARFGDYYFPWWDKSQASGIYQRLEKNRIAAAEVSDISKRRDNIAAGHYHAYTESQTVMIRAVCCWLYLNNPDVFSIDRVVGHDEVSPGRKVDPGGSICDQSQKKSYSMPDFRAVLWNDIDRIYEARKGRVAA